jgi:Four helix bundle sensory module for signal transduction
MQWTVRAKPVGRFALTLFVLVLAVAAVGWRSMTTASVQLERAYERNLQGAVYLAQAQDALWRLRYGFPQFLVLADARDKIRAEEPSLIAIVNENTTAYAEHATTPEEREGLKEWGESWPQYVAARSRWFELVTAGKSDEAAQWRARTTTPLGAASVDTLTKLLKLQQGRRPRSSARKPRVPGRRRRSRWRRSSLER